MVPNGSQWYLMVPNLGQIPSKSRGNIRLISAKSWANLEQISGRSRADPGHILGNSWANHGQKWLCGRLIGRYLTNHPHWLYRWLIKAKHPFTSFVSTCWAESIDITIKLDFPSGPNFSQNHCRWQRGNIQCFEAPKNLFNNFSHICQREYKIYGNVPNFKIVKIELMKKIRTNRGALIKTNLDSVSIDN